VEHVIFSTNAQLFHPSHAIENINEITAPVKRSLQNRSISRNKGIVHITEILKIGERDIDDAICDTTHKKYN